MRLAARKIIPRQGRNTYRARLAAHKTIPRQGRNTYRVRTTCNTNVPTTAVLRTVYDLQYPNYRTTAVIRAMYDLQLAIHKTTSHHGTNAYRLRLAAHKTTLLRQQYVPCTTCNTQQYRTTTVLRLMYDVQLATCNTISDYGSNTYGTMYIPRYDLQLATHRTLPLINNDSRH